MILSRHFNATLRLIHAMFTRMNAMLTPFEQVVLKPDADEGKAGEKSSQAPVCYAIPGNHDWYRTLIPTRTLEP